MRLDRVVQRDHSVFTMAALSGSGGAPAAVTDGGGATDTRRASTRRISARMQASTHSSGQRHSPVDLMPLERPVDAATMPAHADVSALRLPRYQPPQPLYDIKPRLVAAGPARHRPPSAGKSLKQTERSVLPVGGSQNNWNHSCRSRPVSFHSSQHLATVSIIGSQKVGTDKQQDYLSSFQVSINFLTPFLARKDFPVMPDGNEVIAFKLSEKNLQFLAVSLVLVRV